MSKSFIKGARRPKGPTPEAIAAFEAGTPAKVPAKSAGPSAPTGAAAGATTRISVDLPEDLHFRFKLACLKEKTKMTVEMQALIEGWVAGVEAKRK